MAQTFTLILFRNFAADHQGWNSRHPVFDEIISEFKPVVVIDVGVWKGASTLYLADLIDRYVNNGLPPKAPRPV